MNTVEVLFDNVFLVAPDGFKFAAETHEAYPHFCGAGTGFWEKVVSDTIYQVPISVPCHIHDEMWKIAEPTWQAFHASNSVFQHNLMMVIDTLAPDDQFKDHRELVVYGYFKVVDTIGCNVFRELKKVQQLV